MNKKRFNVCILSATLTDLFSNELVKGAISAAKRLDVDLTVMPGKYLGIQHLNDNFEAYYEYQYNILFGYAARAGFDYIIAPVGTIAYAYNNELKKRFLDTFAGTPVLCVASEIEGCDCLEFDNGAGITSAINYLAERGRKHIGIMAGNSENCECIERCDAYRAALEDNGLVFKDSYLMHCDMSYDCKGEAELLLNNNPELDAVICINDIIASVVYTAIGERGKTIGGDIAVVGFDDQPFAKDLTPPLATVKADAFQLGSVSVEKAYNFLNGTEDSRHLVGTQFIPRASCLTDKSISEQADMNERSSDEATGAMPQRYIKRTHLENLFIRDSLMFGGDLKDSYADILKRLCNLGSLTSYLYILKKPIEYHKGAELPDNITWLFKSYCYGANCYNIATDKQEIDTPRVFDNPKLVSDRTRILIAADLFSANTQYGLALLEPESFELIDELELITYQLSSAVRTLDILKNLNDLLTETRLALAMANDYKYIYCVDTKKGSYILYERERTDKDFSLKAKGADFFADCERDCRERVCDEDLEYFHDMFVREIFLDRINEGDLFGFDYRYLKDGKPVYHRLKTIVGTDENEGTVFIGITDIDAQKRRELEMKAELFRDALTGVKNKSAYRNAEIKMDSLIREGICEEFSVFVFDLNDLKRINDNLGHDEGDKYIRSGSSLICKTFDHSPVFRIGGDEFAAILTGDDFKIREQLKAGIKAEIEGNKRSGGVVIAVGSADFINGQDTCLLDVFKRADREMYDDKRRLKSMKAGDDPN